MQFLSIGYNSPISSIPFTKSPNEPSQAHILQVDYPWDS